MKPSEKSSFFVIVATGLILYKGLDLLIQAAAMPVETASARLINWLLEHKWPTATMLNEVPHPLEELVPTAVLGLVLVTIGLLVGNRILRRRNEELEGN